VTATTPDAAAGRPGAGWIERFTPATRALHWATATLVLTCALTGFSLYVGSVSAIVGHREVVRTVHVTAGLLIPVPLVLAYLGPWRRGVRAEFRRLGRWSPADRRWLRSRGREARGEVGKFNAGQKANAAFIAGMIPLMLVSGSVMKWFHYFPLRYRTGATFVHDWTAIVAWAVIAGHILFALNDTGSLRGMVTGRVSRAWAALHHPRWVQEHEAREERSGPPEVVEEAGSPLR
jgi:formate dehydrogenase gamma subunit